MAELWPFIEAGVKKWIVEGRNFIPGGFFLGLKMDGYFQFIRHPKGNFMVSNNI